MSCPGNKTGFDKSGGFRPFGISAAAKANCNALRKIGDVRILRVPKIGVVPVFKILSRFLPPCEFEKALSGDA
ncbi:MAG: hypothetical protein J6R08_04830 [Opitutales bacterium]|nr:hypothetical protein [Opitutales bacterium]